MTRRTRWGLVGGASALVLVGAWLAVGLTPSIVTGAYALADPEQIEEESASTGEVERVVVDPSDGTSDGIQTFQNDGRVPVTVRLSDPPGSAYFWSATLHPVDPRAYHSIGDESAVDAVHVGPGEEFAVKFSFGLGCAESTAGGGAGQPSVELDVTTLGLPRTVTVAFDTPPSVRTTIDHVPAEDCDS